MTAYILRRLTLIPLTLIGIMVVNFAIIQLAPGGPVERMISELRGTAVEATARFSGAGSDGAGVNGASGPAAGGGGGPVHEYRGARGLPADLIADLEKLYGFDKPAYERFFDMMTRYLTFDFGDSFFRDASVIELIADKLPVSISLGLWSTLIIYAVSVPLGIAKAVRDGTAFDVWSSAAVIVGYAIPGFLFAILLIVLFAGGSFLDLFPLRGLVSDNWAELPWWQKILDYFWHLALPLISLTLGGFATLTMLTKNSFLDEIGKQYVITARAKGLAERRVLYGHVFRNAMLIVISGLPGTVVGLLFTGALLIEVIFSLDGLGLLAYEAVINRDYPIVFSSLYIFTLLGLVLNLIGDLMYVVIDPRIDFESRET